jgi:RNA polymerase sigma factor (sigma-70 family)
LDNASFIRACREGGAAIEQALRTLDRSFFAILFRDGVRTLGDREAARDLVQDTFIKVWQRCATFRGESELLSWIKVILRRAAIERLRRNTREEPMEDEHGLTEGAARHIAQLSLERNPTPETVARREELSAAFRRGWERFIEDDPVHASVMRWVVEDGLTTEDISQLLGRTPGATREFVSQCRKSARRYLGEWYALAQDTGDLV